MTKQKITVVGAGQSGLQLGISLIDEGYEVTMVSNRTPDEIRDGRVASSQCMFDQALSHERAHGLDLWPDAPTVDGISFTIPHPELAGQKAFSFTHRLDAPAQSIDQRVKYPVFMQLFADRGGELLYADAGIDELEEYTASSDLVLVAAGKGEIAGLFTRDDQRSVYDKPQRALALTYVNGLKPREDFSAVAFNLIPGVGEYFVFPALTTTGPCEIMVFEGLPGGPMDQWKGLSPQEHLEHSKWILNTFLPWEGERAVDAQLTDDMGVLQGRFPPTVRHPIATLPSGRTVLGMADVVVLNDPITGQGSNNASKCAASYLQSVLEHGSSAYDGSFMQDTFETYWNSAQHVTKWTNTMLAPPAEYAVQLLGAASQNGAIAKRFVNGFNDPADFENWFLDADKAASYLAEVSASAPTAEAS